VHILQLTDLYTPVIGGLERHVATLSAELQRRGHTVTVVTIRVRGLPVEEVIDDVRVIRIPSLSQRISGLYADSSHPFHPTAPDPEAVLALRRLVERERPDVVHSHSWLQYSYFPLYHPRQGPVHVVTLHDYGLACPRKTLQPSSDADPCSGPRLGKCLACAPRQYGVVKGAAITSLHRGSRFLHRRADRYLAVSSSVARHSLSALPAGTEITVIPSMIPNGVSELAMQASRPDFLPADDGYLMFIGALGRHKGVDVLLEAHRRMRHKVPVVLLGTPRPDTPPLTQPGVFTTRNVPHAQAMAAMRHSSIAIVPSVWHEPMSQVAVEAMVVGRPVVASDVGGLRDVVQHDVTGLRVPPRDPGALAMAIDGLLDDPERRAKMGCAGRQRARQFEASAVTPRILEVFEDALRDRVRA
jgi:glycosyltransferase involved in cell wall biosynthesis